MRPTILTLLASPVLMFVVACSSGTDAPNPVPHDRFAAEYANALCSPAPTRCAQYGIEVDEDACVQRVTAEMQATVDEQIALWPERYRPELAGRCIALTEALYTGAFVDEEMFFCGAAFAADESFCLEDADCHGADKCIPADGRQFGVCRRAGRLGEACVGDVYTMYGITTAPGPYAADEGAYCFQKDGLTCGDARTCVAVHAQGEACQSTAECPAGTVCRSLPCAGASDPECHSAICARPVGSGQPCEDHRDCTAGLHCATSSGTCQPAKDAGAACASAIECAWWLCDDGICRAPAELACKAASGLTSAMLDL